MVMGKFVIHFGHKLLVEPVAHTAECRQHNTTQQYMATLVKLLFWEHICKLRTVDGEPDGNFRNQCKGLVQG